MECKRCAAVECVKNGMVRGKQRWRCKSCDCNFTEGDGRKARSTPQQKALAILLVSMGFSFRAVGRLTGVVTNTVMVWFRAFAQPLGLSPITRRVDILEINDIGEWIQQKRATPQTVKPQRLMLIQLDAAMSQWAVIDLED